MATFRLVRFIISRHKDKLDIGDHCLSEIYLVLLFSTFTVSRCITVSGCSICMAQPLISSGLGLRLEYDKDVDVVTFTMSMML